MGKKIFVECPICGKEVKSQGRAGHFNYSHKDKDYDEYKDKWDEIPPGEAEREYEDEESDQGVTGEQKKGEKEEEGKYQPDVKMEEEKDEEEPLFKSPKKPHEILRNVCDEWGCTKKFKKFVVTRCKRGEEGGNGAMTPEEFRYKLQRMNSGWENGEEIREIAEDYYYQLQRERQKAQDMELDRPISYPVEQGANASAPQPMNRNNKRSVKSRRDDFGRRTSSRQRYDDGRGDSRGQRERDRQQDLTSDDIREIIREEQQQQQKKSKLDRTEEKIDKLTDIIEEQQQQIREAKQEAQQPSVPEGVVTEDELQEKEKNQYIDYLEKRSKDAKDTREKALDELKEEREKMREELKEQREDYEDQIEKMLGEVKKSSRSSGDYKDDQYKFISESLNRAADVVEKRTEDGRPIEIAVRGLQRLEEGEERPPEREREEESRSQFQEIDEDFIED